MLAGAILTVIIFLASKSANRFGNLPCVQWLGRISFSLYVVHFPVTLACVSILGPTSIMLSLAVSIPIVFFFAQAFYILCERPAHKLSIALGRSLARKRLGLPRVWSTPDP